MLQSKFSQSSSQFLAKPKRGFVLGKFLPPTKGHTYLCEFARQYCERLTILVCSLPNEPIPGELRFKWMKEMFPDCDVLWEDRELPQEPRDENDTEFWESWKGVIRGACQQLGYDIGIGGTYWEYPDVVFASENYGHRLAASVGARFVPVDIDRTTVPISGTKVRENPFAHWGEIPDVVKPYFVKRVCMFGPESTGKSTIARELGKMFATTVVPEYGRVYTEAFGTEVGPEELRHIVQGHLASVAAAKRRANRILIEDTDPVMTAVWSTMLTGQRDPWFDQFNDLADLYLLCDVNIPWADDGTRYFPDQADRERFFQLCEDELKRRGANYTVIRRDKLEFGQFERSYMAAAKAITKAFPELPQRFY